MKPILSENRIRRQINSKSTSQFRSVHFHKSATILVCIGLSMFLAACNSQRHQTMPSELLDYDKRHPIILADTDRSLDVFVTSARHLDSRQRSDLAAFAGDYRRNAKSAVLIKIPVTAEGSVTPEIKNSLLIVRQNLISGGVNARAIKVQYYHNSGNASLPIKISFTRLQAKVDSECGQWPTDLAGGDSLTSWKNEPYWNLGCSYQKALAAQVANPIDLVRGRQEELVDTTKRMSSINKLREGKDPSTQYRQNAKTISNIGN